ncbi:MAG TPA: YXWGXW repeat-containing protein [bacterium]|nr:YXWGXW repeat-containing protein [bacterium]
MDTPRDFPADIPARFQPRMESWDFERCVEMVADAQRSRAEDHHPATEECPGRADPPVPDALRRRHDDRATQLVSPCTDAPSRGTLRGRASLLPYGGIINMTAFPPQRRTVKTEGGGHILKNRLAALALVFAIAGGAIVAPTIAAPTTASALTVIVAPGPPPGPIYERVPPRPAPGWVWVGGHWAWNGARWVWIRGYWAQVPRYRTAWVPGHWAHRAGGWVWIEGHWR